MTGLPSDSIFIERLEFVGHHGVFAHERKNGCRFQVDARLWFPTSRAAATDSLKQTVDYAAVAASIVEVGTGQSVYLVERLAASLAEMVLETFGVERVEICLRKLNPPILGAPDAVGVCIVRERGVS